MTLRAISLVLAGIVASLVGASPAASEQAYPNQVVRIVVPFSAGSITDGLARILADKLGFYDAFVGEHLTDGCETITNSMMFNASLISDTKQIKLATGTTNLSHMHPVLIAQHAAMFDHLSEGRFILGVSPGALTTDAEALGILDQDRNKMFAEAIDVILAIWERDRSEEHTSDSSH